ncbi:MAG TPA: hypothetical protein PLP11_11410, partial [Bacteroidales bacterium]|nr:hypothetical protein [Bacteroidales bacterium]
MNNKNSKIVNLIASTGFWGVVIIAALAVQLVLFILFSYRSVCLASGMLFWAIPWWLTTIIMKHNSQKLKTAIHSVFGTLMLVEVVLRASGFVANYWERQHGYYKSVYNVDPSVFVTKRTPGVYQISNRDCSFEIATNSWGYRDKEWNPENMNSKIRIMALGDSFTEGYGAPADSTWMNLLEKDIADTGYYFINGGMIGSDPVADYNRLKTNLIGLDPNIILFAVNITDLSDLMLRGGIERLTNGAVVKLKAPWWEVVYAMSHTLRLVLNRFFDASLLVSHKQLVMQQEKYLSMMEKFCITVSNEFSDRCKVVFIFHP